MAIPVLSNLTPANGATGVSLRPKITLRISTPGAHLDISSISVTLNGQLSFDGSTIVPGDSFSGFPNGYTYLAQPRIDWNDTTSDGWTYDGNPSTNTGTTLDLSFYRLYFFDPGETETLEVIARDTSGNLLDTTYSFTTGTVQTDPYLINRSDSVYQGAGGYVASTDFIQFDQVCEPYSDTLTSNTDVTLDGVPVVIGGVGQNGYSFTTTGGFYPGNTQTTAQQHCELLRNDGTTGGPVPSGNPVPWTAGSHTVAVTTRSTTKTSVQSFSFTTQPNLALQYPSGSTCRFDLGATVSVLSGIRAESGYPIYTLFASVNGGSPIQVSSAGDSQNGWTVSALTESSAVPQPPFYTRYGLGSAYQRTTFSLTPPALTTGDMVAFTLLSYLENTGTSNTLWSPLTTWSWTLGTAETITSTPNPSSSATQRDPATLWSVTVVDSLNDPAVQVDSITATLNGGSSFSVYTHSSGFTAGWQGARSSVTRPSAGTIVVSADILGSLYASLSTLEFTVVASNPNTGKGPLTFGPYELVIEDYAQVGIWPEEGSAGTEVTLTANRILSTGYDISFLGQQMLPSDVTILNTGSGVNYSSLKGLILSTGASSSSSSGGYLTALQAAFDAQLVVRYPQHRLIGQAVIYAQLTFDTSYGSPGGTGLVFVKLCEDAQFGLSVVASCTSLEGISAFGIVPLSDKTGASPIDLAAQPITLRLVRLGSLVQLSVLTSVDASSERILGTFPRLNTSTGRLSFSAQNLSTSLPVKTTIQALNLRTHCQVGSSFLAQKRDLPELRQISGLVPALLAGQSAGAQPVTLFGPWGQAPCPSGFDYLS